MKGTYMTPEEIAWRKQRNRSLGYLLVPVFAIFLGAIISIIAN
ncbi:hypothetical protein [Pseudalkalibacillus hwajinpoensis]|nr:hypothetical protein [Pseudalkalibacillus hwajinpoensis]